MRQQLECEVARPGYEAAATQGLALGVCVCVSLCVSVCLNVRGKSPVSLGPGETMAIHTVCYSFGRSCVWWSGG